MKLERLDTRLLPMVSRLAACALVASLLLAQEPEPEFRTSTQLVQVDVVVKSKDVPVTGLTKDDFAVFDNGKPQQIAVFSVREMGAPPQIQPLLPGVFSNRPIYRGPEPVSATVILFDSINTPVEDQGYARLQALKYLDNASRNELIAVYQMDTAIRILQTFTADRDQIRRAVDRFSMVQSFALQDGQDGLLRGLKDNAAQAVRLNNMQRRIDATWAALEGLALHLKGLPGRKKLVWITAGVPPTITQQTVRNDVVVNDYYDMSDKLYAPARSLNDANVAVYAVHPGGAMVNLADPGLTTTIYFAQKTGGKAVYGSNDVAGEIEAAITDTDLTYTLGFYSMEETRNAQQHSLRVNVKRSGVEARYRQTYSDDGLREPVTDKLRNGTLSGWMQQPLDSTEIPIFAGAAPVANKPGYYEVAVKIDVGAIRLEERKGRFVGSIELAIAPDVEKKPKGLRQRIAINLKPETLPNILANGFVVVNQIRAANDKGKLLSKRLHVVVMDNATAKTGSLRIPLEEK